MVRGLKRNDDGIALVIAIVFVCAAVAAVNAVTMRLVHHSRLVDRFAASTVCFAGAEFALAQSVDRLSKGKNGSIGLDQWKAPAKLGVGVPRMAPVGSGLVFPSFSDTGVAPERIASTPEVEYFCFALDWAKDGLDNNGDGIADGPEEKDLYSVYAFARAGGSVRCVEAVYSGGGGRALRRLSWRERQCTNGVVR